MAVDEVLLDVAARTGRCTLRFYQWQPATLTLGYFQKLDDRSLHSDSHSCPVVRRATGGGAIVHDQELTYSFSAPVSSPIARQPQVLYDAFHGTLVKTLKTWDLSASLYPPTHSNPPAEPFLCFQRRSEGDVVLDGQKIAGSAQRRHKRAVLQHGSILLRSSKFAPQLPGIAEIQEAQVEVQALTDRWLEALTEALEMELLPEQLRPEEAAQAKKVAGEKFADRSWTERR